MDIDLMKDGIIPPVSLIQMPNGTGKTTIEELMSVALTGIAPSPEILKEYARFDEDFDQGEFNLTLYLDEDGEY